MLPNEVFALACRERYAEDGLVVDESNGEFAHCPLPRSMGDSGYYLLHEDHQWQGLLQSKDLGRRCYYTYETQRWLMDAPFVDGYFELWDIYDEFNSHPDETRRKLSEALKGIPKSEETRRRMSEARKGVTRKPLTEEHKRKVSEGQKGEKNHRSRAIIVTKPCGTELHYGAMVEAQRELNISEIPPTVKTGKILTRGKFKGWQFRYA